MRVFSNVDELVAAQGEHLGHSEWHTVNQQQIDTFADATGDHQWIHVDVERASQGPFGTTIAHGYLTLSMLPMFGSQIYRIEGVKMGINYGSNKVRFPNTVAVGSRVRGGIELAEVTDVAQGKQLIMKHVVEIEGKDKPACVAETVTLIIP